MGVTADDLRHADVVESGNAARVRLIDVVAQTKLAVAVVTPTENLGWEGISGFDAVTTIC